MTPPNPMPGDLRVVQACEVLARHAGPSVYVNAIRANDALHAMLAFATTIEAAARESAAKVAEIPERPGSITADDVPDWITMPADRYVAMREQQIDQELRQVNGAAFEGSWVRLAAQTLWTIGTMAPEQGSHHHACIIIAEALRPLYATAIRESSQ